MNVVLHSPGDGQQGGKGVWYHFKAADCVRVIAAHALDEVRPALEELEREAHARGLYAAGFLAYEAAPAFDPALTVRPDPSGFPLLWFGLFSAREETAALPRPPPSPATQAEPTRWTASITRAEYGKALRRLKAFLYDGDTYQVNFSFRLSRPFTGDSWALFQDLVAAQGAHYAAYVDTGNFALCSASPELFFRLDGAQLESQPMKGTARRGLTACEDRSIANRLRNSSKNLAENVMIVDMIRNDMGRIAQPGSVTPEPLFEIKRYPTVWQMVSTVSARTHAPVTEIMAALFPCASITGAPKPRTMEIIAETETLPRRIYTGTIGMIEPGRRALFNVAIRTVLIDRQTRQAEYGTGGGIVWDSETGSEYEECQLKATILTERPPEFALLETLLWTPDRGYLLLERHLQRLTESADYFGIPALLPEIRARLEQAVTPAGHPARSSLRLRLLISPEGAITVEAHPFTGNRSAEPVRVKLATHPIDPMNRFLYHKTTHRRVYEEAKAGQQECDDVLLWNTKGELTESTVANLVVERGGQRLTPPVSCGLLPGTFRAECLERGEISEAILRVDELARCQRLWLINSVRQWREVRLVT